MLPRPIELLINMMKPSSSKLAIKKKNVMNVEQIPTPASAFISNKRPDTAVSTSVPITYVNVSKNEETKNSL